MSALYSIQCPECGDPMTRDVTAGPGGWWRARGFIEWLLGRPREWVTCPTCHGDGVIACG